MIHFLEKTLENLQAYVPLMQTLVWPTFLFLLLIIFRKHIYCFLEEVLSRIQAGGGIRIGSLELFPATPEQQAKKIEEEIKQRSNAKTPHSTGVKEANRSQENSLLITSLALKKLASDRKLSVEQGVSLGRNGYLLDGLLRGNGRLGGVEVKIVYNNQEVRGLVDNIISKVIPSYERMADGVKQGFYMIVIIVEATPLSPEKMHSMLASQAHDFPVTTITYDLQMLKAEFGII